MKIIAIVSLIVGVIGAVMIGTGPVDKVLLFVGDSLMVFIPLTLIRLVYLYVRKGNDWICQHCGYPTDKSPCVNCNQA